MLTKSLVKTRYPPRRRGHPSAELHVFEATFRTARIGRRWAGGNSLVGSITAEAPGSAIFTAPCALRRRVGGRVLGTIFLRTQSEEAAPWGRVRAR